MYQNLPGLVLCVFACFPFFKFISQLFGHFRHVSKFAWLGPVRLCLLPIFQIYFSTVWPFSSCIKICLAWSCASLLASHFSNLFLNCLAIFVMYQNLPGLVLCVFACFPFFKFISQLF